MKYNTPEELNEYIMGEYFEYGRYYVQDKMFPREVFDFEVKTWEEVKEYIKLFDKTINIGHPKLSDNDYHYAAGALQNETILKWLMKLYDDGSGEKEIVRLEDEIRQITDDVELMRAVLEF